MIRNRSAGMLIFATLALHGCATTLRTPEDVRQYAGIARGVEYTRESGFQVGEGLTTLVRTALSASSVETPALVDAIDELEVATYRTEAWTLPQKPVVLQPSDFSGWDPLVTMQTERSENFLALGRGRGDSIRHLLLVVDGGAKLTVVRVEGYLDDVVEQAMKFALDRAERPDLIDGAERNLAAPAE